MMAAAREERRRTTARTTATTGAAEAMTTERRCIPSSSTRVRLGPHPHRHLCGRAQRPRARDRRRLVYTLESNRIRADITAKIDQETAELAALQREGIDPETGEGFTSVTRLLDTFLVRNVPDDDEMLVGYWGGRSVERTQHRYGADVLRSPSFRAAVDELLPAGGTETVELPRAGLSWVTVQPVRDRTTSGALIVVTFTDEERDELIRVMRTYAVVSLFLLLLIVGAAWLQAGRLLRPLRALRDGARDITATDLSRRLPEKGNDDITQLTATFNTMLGRLEEGFNSQRQFLDDAGHELRTPLTVLRGHLELVDHADPDEVAETRELLLDEIDRMSGLVDELILLAKSGRPDFVNPAPTHLAGLVDQRASEGDRPGRPRLAARRPAAGARDRRPGRAADHPGIAPAL